MVSASPEQRRFLKKVPNRPTGECWLWTAGTFKTGYGAFWHADRMQRAHRVAYELFVGPVPEGLMVLHSCDVRACVNPAHLGVGTRRQNTDEAVTRRRMASGDRNGLRTHPERNPAVLYPDLRPRGESHGRSPLTAENVADIRSRYANGERQVILARRFGISQAAISKIVRAEAWSHVP